MKRWVAIPGLLVILACTGCKGSGERPSRGDPEPSGARVEPSAGRAGDEGRPPSPGYHGPVPSGTAQGALKELRGQWLKGAGGVLGPEELVIVAGFAVVPNPVTGKGPVVILERPTAEGAARAKANARTQGEGGHFWVPVETDGDAADFIRRVTGSAPAGLAGPTSAAYRKTLGLE